MTHDELKEKLIEAYPAPIYHAIRAVVELHKPWEIDKDIAGEPILRCSCSDCTDGYSVYPCLTIQAIEKELR